jgi:hypothetical protein
VIGKGDANDEALADIKSELQFHGDGFEEEEPVLTNGFIFDHDKHFLKKAVNRRDHPGAVADYFAASRRLTGATA